MSRYAREALVSVPHSTNRGHHVPASAKTTWAVTEYKWNKLSRVNMCKFNQVPRIQTAQVHRHADLKLQTSFNAENVSTVRSHRSIAFCVNYYASTFLNNLHEPIKVCASAAPLPVSSFLPEGAPSDNSRTKTWTPGKPNAGVNAFGDWRRSCRKVVYYQVSRVFL